MEADISSIETRVINALLNWATIAKNSKKIEYADNGKTFSVRWDEFWDKNDFRIFKHIEEVFDNLQTNKCFKSWQLNSYKNSDNAEYIFSKIDIVALQSFKESINLITFQSDETVVYDDKNKILYFKVEARKPEVLDFSSAPSKYEITDIIWTLRVSEPGKISFTREEMKNKYKEQNNKDIPTFDLSHGIGAIRRRIRNKPLLEKRFTLKFNRKIAGWDIKLF